MKLSVDNLDNNIFINGHHKHGGGLAGHGHGVHGSLGKNDETVINLNLNSNSKGSKNSNECQNKNLDELYEYIIAEDPKNNKKQNKKAANKTNVNANNPKKKSSNINTPGQLPNSNCAAGINEKNINLNVNNNLIDMDKEIEEFKTKIKNETIHANDVRKVKPKISKEWIQHIQKL